MSDRARMVLRTAATIVILYGLLFQATVGLAFGWAWSVATIALILFGAATLWSCTTTRIAVDADAGRPFPPCGGRAIALMKRALKSPPPS